MPLLERILTPINSLLPDISRVPQRRQAVGAIVASLVLHLILLLLFVAVVAILPDNKMKLSMPEVVPAPLEVEIVMPPPEEDLVTPEELQAEAKRENIDSSGLAQSKEEPKDAVFESSQNMKAASELAARGALPLPSQDGSTNNKQLGPMFKGTRERMGRPDGEGKDAEALPLTAPETAAAPAPTAKEESKEVTTPDDKAKKLPTVSEPKADEIAITQKLKPRVSSPDMALRPLPGPAEKTDMAKLTTPAPKRGREAKYQGAQWETRVDGSITNRGRKAVDAVKTPRGVYTKQVNAQIGSRWTYFVRAHPDRYAFGYARVRFDISRDGTVSNVEIVENTANETFGLMCQQSVFEAEIMPVPEDVYPVMTDGKLEITFTFNYVPFQ